MEGYMAVFGREERSGNFTISISKDKENYFKGKFLIPLKLFGWLFCFLVTFLSSTNKMGNAHTVQE